MEILGTYDSKIYHNPANKYSIVIMRTTDTSVPEEARSKRYYRDRYIRFTAIGYELPLTLDNVRNCLMCDYPKYEILYNQAIIDGICKSAALGREIEINIPEI